MLIDTSTIADLRTAFSGIYQAAYDTAPSVTAEIATGVPSSTRSNTYGWMTKLPGMREWVGPRVIANLEAAEYVITNKPYEVTVGVERDDIADDNLGVYDPMMAMLGDAARKHPDKLLVDLLQSGTTALAHDGLAFFAAHTGGTNNATSCGLSAANVALRFGVMGAFNGEDGKPLGIRPNLLVVPPQLEFTARQIVEAVNDASGATNVLRGLLRVLVIPELGNAATTWYLMDTSKPIKPLVLQTRMAPAFVSKDAPTDDGVFYNRQLVYGVDARWGVGFGLWFLASRQIA